MGITWLGKKSFLYGKSVANQRIEAWWGFLRKSITDWWMRFFKDLTDQGHFDNSSVIHVQCLRFCFMGLMREELYKVAKNWNLHKIRPSNTIQTHHMEGLIHFFFSQRRRELRISKRTLT